jgi:hypothetical protein
LVELSAFAVRAVSATMRSSIETASDLAGEEVAESVCDATVLDAHEAATPGGAVVF